MKSAPASTGRDDNTGIRWRLNRARVAGLACALAAGACSRAAPTPTPSPALPTYSGVIVDVYTKRPLAGARLQLTQHCDTSKIYHATTDAEGRYRFEIPSSCGRMFLLSGRACEQCDHETLDSIHPEDGPYQLRSRDLGTHPLANRAWATQTFGPVCAGGAPPPDVSAAPGLIILVWDWKRGEWDANQDEIHWEAKGGPWEALYQKGYAFLRVPEVEMPWPAALCLKHSRRLVGDYGGLTKAYAVSTRVTLVRLPDGRRTSTVLTAQPPKTIQRQLGGIATSGSAYHGDTDPLLLKWLRKEVTAGNT